MDIVDCREIEVLFMPAEKCFPWANIAIGSGHASHIGVNWEIKDRFEAIQIPRASSLIHESIQQVSSIERRRENNVFPELNLPKNYHIFDLIRS